MLLEKEISGNNVWGFKLSPPPTICPPATIQYMGVVVVLGKKEVESDLLGRLFREMIH